MSNPRFLLIAQPNSYRIAPYIKAVQQMGYEVLIASRGEHSLITEIHEGLHVDLDNNQVALKQILAQAEKKPFVGILGSDDSTVELAAMAASRLGLPHNPPDAAKLSRRKDLARAHLALAGCPVPVHCLLDLSQDIKSQTAGLPWPCVIKPLNLSASRGVIRANTPDDFITACERIRKILASSYDDSTDPFERNHLLIEDYIEGIEVAYEGYLQQGELKTLALFDKPDPLVGPYFEETIYVTPSRLDETMQSLVKQRVQQACSAYGLVCGPVHAELRINKQDAWILEVATRTIGGECGRMLDNGHGFNIEALTIALATGKPVTVEKPAESRGVMMIPIKKGGLLRRVEGINAARKVRYVERVDIIIQSGHELIPLPEGNQYPGYIFARADSPQAVVQALRDAHNKLEFVTAPIFKIQ